MSPQPTQVAVVQSNLPSSKEAGHAMGEEIKGSFLGEKPDALILFVSPRYDAQELSAALAASCDPAVLVGCSSAGEFTDHLNDTGHACAVAIRSGEMKFAASLGRNLSTSRQTAADEVMRGLHGVPAVWEGYSSALILTDALAGHADELIEALTLRTGANYQFFGGGAGDDANFRRTEVICGREVCSDAVAVLEILSRKPLGIGVRHGWKAASSPMRVTKSAGSVIYALDGMPALEMIQEHARATGQKWDALDPLPYFLHNIIGIQATEGFKLRVPLAIGENGSIVCAAEVPSGALVCFMGTDLESARNAASEATRDALTQIAGHAPKFALFFDCVATRLRLGRDFGLELSSLQKTLGDAPFAGCNTYGQVARVDGQFNGFHNCTAVVCIFPE